MDGIAPVIPFKSENIKILEQPRDFYDCILNGIENAKQTINLVSLYLGSNETELVSYLKRAMERNPKLKIHILIDGLRGSRVSGGSSSVQTLEPLKRDFPNQFKLSLYHTPNLKGLLKRVFPQRFNEGFGLQHIKCYQFDSNVIISGANLNRDYFTNRQDRYVLFEQNQQLSAYFDDLVNAISSLSDNEPIGKVPEPFEKFIKKYQNFKSNQEFDTFVVPTIQMGLFGIRQDEHLIKKILLTYSKSDLTIHFSSGYLNFPLDYTDLMLKSNSKFSVLTSSPQANGFYNSKGISKHLPSAYTFIEKRFMEKVQDRNFLFSEYNRTGWTWHAKGLWIEDNKSPFMTVVGSSNFGNRSLNRDLEAQVLIHTKNQELSSRLKQNLDFLYKYSNRVDLSTLSKPDRRVNPVVKVLTRAIKTML